MTATECSCCRAVSDQCLAPGCVLTAGHGVHHADAAGKTWWDLRPTAVALRRARLAKKVKAERERRAKFTVAQRIEFRRQTRESSRAQSSGG